MAGKTVHVVGDTIVDSLTQCAMIGGQTKTPTMSVLYQEQDGLYRRRRHCGKAPAGRRRRRVFSTVLGDDPLKEFVLDGLEESGVEVRRSIDETGRRPTRTPSLSAATGC